LRTTRLGNGAEKVRKITVTKPDAMAARKKRQGRNETLDDLQQNEDERRRIRPLLKTNSKAPERSSSCPANVLRRLDERKAVGVEGRYCEPFQPRPLRPPVVFKPCGFFLEIGVGPLRRVGFCSRPAPCRGGTSARSHLSQRARQLELEAKKTSKGETGLCSSTAHFTQQGRCVPRYRRFQ
jgi:hypothetical protein